jgi:RNA-directed DNA polymerase
VNTDAPRPTPEQAKARVLGIQTKLHQWATDDPDRRFDDLVNLVHDPAFLLVAWRRVKGNKGARTAGVDGRTALYVSAVRGEEGFLADLRTELKARRFGPLPVRERLLPKPGGSRRRLGIPTVTDRVVQAALKLVLEPILEADFQPCSYGFRPGRRAQDAIAEIHHLTSRPAGSEWVVEGDITACFDTIDHTALLARVRRRIADRRVLALIKAFCKAGILTQDGATQDAITGTPKGASSPRCWPTSPSAPWTSTSPRPGRASARPGRARSAPARALGPGGWSATPTTSRATRRHGTEWR